MMVAHLGDYFWGRSPFYQATLHGYGMHTFSHLATVALARRYTPGVATALPVILPLLDRRKTDAAGPRDRGAPSPMGDPPPSRSSLLQCWVVRTW